MASNLYGAVVDYSGNTGLAYAVLLVLADNGGWYGNGKPDGVLPTPDHLAWLTRIPERRIPALLEVLTNSGELVLMPDARGHLYYRIELDKREAPPTLTPPSTTSQAGYVYLVQTEQGLYKIGCTANPKQRAAQFRRTIPFQTSMLHVIPTANMEHAEDYLHSRFASKRVRGEWFRLSEQDVQAICAIDYLENIP